MNPRGEILKIEESWGRDRAGHSFLGRESFSYASGHVTTTLPICLWASA